MSIAMDSSKNHTTVTLLEAAAGEAPRPPPPTTGNHRPRLVMVGPSNSDDAGLLGAVRVACDCGIIASLDVREGPWRRLQLALVGLAYAAVAALVWFGRALPADGCAQWKKLTATLAATAVGGGLAYCTNSAVPCGLFLFIYIL